MKSLHIKAISFCCIICAGSVFTSIQAIAQSASPSDEAGASNVTGKPDWAASVIAIEPSDWNLRPDVTGVPDAIGKPDWDGQPDWAGRPDWAAKPELAGRPDWADRPEDPSALSDIRSGQAGLLSDRGAVVRGVRGGGGRRR